MSATEISFTVYCKPEPQGSSRAFMSKGKPVITSTNKGLKPFRQAVAQVALMERNDQGHAGVIFGKHVPVEATFIFYFLKPPSAPKKRKEHVVKPDLSKLVRATEDSLTGIIYADDAQIVGFPNTRKFYGAPERVEITVRAHKEDGA